eukprot:Gb_22074 [translate_table: standard]
MPSRAYLQGIITCMPAIHHGRPAQNQLSTRLNSPLGLRNPNSTTPEPGPMDAGILAGRIFWRAAVSGRPGRKERAEMGLIFGGFWSRNMRDFMEFELQWRRIDPHEIGRFYIIPRTVYWVCVQSNFCGVGISGRIFLGVCLVLILIVVSSLSCFASATRAQSAVFNTGMNKKKDKPSGFRPFKPSVNDCHTGNYVHCSPPPKQVDNANNITGAEKRVVPTGPNPLHNR